MNNKMNEAFYPHKNRPSSKGQNHTGGGGTYYLSSRQIDPKPSTGSIAHGVWMMHVRLLGC